MRRIEADFPGRIEAVAGQLNLVVSENQNRERILAAVVLGAAGNERVLAEMIELSAIDWRDVLVIGELAGGDWPEKLDQILDA
jgi:hypothetical protein